MHTVVQISTLFVGYNVTHAHNQYQNPEQVPFETSINQDILSNVNSFHSNHITVSRKGLYHYMHSYSAKYRGEDVHCSDSRPAT